MAFSSLLLQSVSVTVGAGGSAAFAHSLNLQGLALVPNIVQPNIGTPLVVSAVTTSTFTVSNPDGSNSHTADFFVEYEHSIQRDALNSPLPTLYWQGLDVTASGGSSTLQQAYDTGTAGQAQPIVLGSGGRLAVAIRDAAAPIAGNLLEVTNNANSSTFLGVTTVGTSTSQGMTMLNSAVAVSAAGSVRLRSSGGVLQVSQNGGAYTGLLETLSGAYLAGSAGPQTITLDATRLGIVVNDAANVGGDLFAVTDGTNAWFSVRNNVIRIGADAIQFQALPGAGPFSMSPVAPTTANTAGFPLLVGSGAGSASNNAAAGGAGSTMALFSGNGGAGGAAQLPGVGGPLTITAGDGGVNNGGGGAAGGSITVQAGIATGAAANGSITLSPGAGSSGSPTAGSIICAVLDAATATTTDCLTLFHTSTGTALANYGTGLLFRGQDGSSTAGGDDMIRLAATWTNAGSTTEASQLLVQTRTSGGALTTTGTFAGDGSFTATGTVTAAALVASGAALPLLVTITDASAATQIEAARLRHLSSTAGTVGIGVYESFWASNAVAGGGTLAEAARIKAMLRGVTNATENGAIEFMLNAAGTMSSAGHITGTTINGTTAVGVGTISATGVTTQLCSLVGNNGSIVGLINNNASAGGIQLAGTVNTSGVRAFFIDTPSANTGITTATERVTRAWGSGHTNGVPSLTSIVQTWANGTVALQRENVWVAPTYLQTSGTQVMTVAVHHDFGSIPKITGTTNSLTGARVARFGGDAAQGVTAAATTYVGIELVASTITYTGATQVTSTVAASQLRLDVLTLTDASAVTVNRAASLDIVGPVAAAGSVTLTDPLSVYVRTGTSKFNGRVIMSAPNSAIADAALDASQLSFYLNEAGNLVTVKAKYADGTTIKTGSIAII